MDSEWSHTRIASFVDFYRERSCEESIFATIEAQPDAQCEEEAEAENPVAVAEGEVRAVVHANEHL